MASENCCWCKWFNIFLRLQIKDSKNIAQLSHVCVCLSITEVISSVVSCLSPDGFHWNCSSTNKRTSKRPINQNFAHTKNWWLNFISKTFTIDCSGQRKAACDAKSSIRYVVRILGLCSAMQQSTHSPISRIPWFARRSKVTLLSRVSGYFASSIILTPKLGLICIADNFEIFSASDDCVFNLLLIGAKQKLRGWAWLPHGDPGSWILVMPAWPRVLPSQKKSHEAVERRLCRRDWAATRRRRRRSGHPWHKFSWKHSYNTTCKCLN